MGTTNVTLSLNEQANELLILWNKKTKLKKTQIVNSLIFGLQYQFLKWKLEEPETEENEIYLKYNRILQGAKKQFLEVLEEVIEHEG